MDDEKELLNFGDDGFFGDNLKYPENYAKNKSRIYKQFKLQNPRYISNYFAILLIRYLHVPYTEWPAYDLGLIDAEGNEIGKPIDLDERRAYNYYIKTIIKLRKLIERAIPSDIRVKYLMNKLLMVRESNEVAVVLDELGKLDNKEINGILTEITTSGSMATNGTGLDLGKEASDIAPTKKKKEKIVRFKKYIDINNNTKELGK